MFQDILERNKVYIQNQKLYFPLDQEVIRAVHILNEQKIFTLSGLRHTGKTKLVHALLKKTQSFDQCFYFNGDIDTL